MKYLMKCIQNYTKWKLLDVDKNISVLLYVPRKLGELLIRYNIFQFMYGNRTK